MSHDRTQDRIELQRYFSETSNSSTPNGTLRASASNMSGSGSFGSAAVPIPHTDTDNQQNPTYSSIPEATHAHQQYRAAQVSPGRTPSGHEGESGNGEIQYELIPEKHKAHSTAPLPAGVTKQADNVLYVGTDDANELHMRHKALTMEKVQTHKRFEGSLSPEPQDFAKEGGGGCRRGCVLCVGLLFTLLLVVALAAGVLALAIIFTGFVDSPLCSCATGGGSVDSATIQQLMDRIDTLEMMLSATTPPPVQPGATTLPGPTELVMTEATPPPVLVGGVVTLSDVDLYEECTTSIEQTCDVNPAIGACIPEMVPIVLNETESHVQNINCVRIPFPGQQSVESNPLVAFLDFPESNLASCVCTVLDEVFGPRASTVRCGIRVTRCTRPSNLTATIN